MSKSVTSTTLSADGRIRSAVRSATPGYRGRRLWRVGLYLLVVILLVWALAPLLWLVVSSVSTRRELYATPTKHWIPQHPTLANYAGVFSGGTGFRGGSSTPDAGLLFAGVRNSLITSVGTAAILTVLSTLAAYAFARFRFRGKSALFLVMMFLLPLPVWVSLIQLYFLISSLGLLDSDIGLIFIFVAFGLPLYVWIMETYIRSLPQEIEEAAMIDGCSRLGVLIRVILPIAVPGLATVFLTSLLTTWNAFLLPLIFTNTAASQTLPVILSLFVGQYEVSWEAMSAAAVITLLPPVCMAFFFQRYLVRGLSLGAVR